MVVEKDLSKSQECAPEASVTQSKAHIEQNFNIHTPDRTAVGAKMNNRELAVVAAELK